MECSYCNSQFKEPRVLCCSRLCRACLQTHIQNTVKDDFIACLVCRTKIKIPDPYRPREEWADQYRADLFLQRMLLAAEQVSTEHNCFVCDSSRGAVTPSTQYCFNCDTYYCDGCNELHLQLRGLQGHLIVNVQKLQTKDLMTKRKLYCPTHKDKLLDVFCKAKRPDAPPTSALSTPTSSALSVHSVRSENGHVVCSTCAEEMYRSHQTMPVSKAAKGINDKLKKVRDKIVGVIEVQEKRSEILNERSSRMTSHELEKLNEIETAFSKIQTAIDERKNYLLQKASETSTRNGRGLENMAVQSTQYLEALKDVKTLLTWMDECGTEHDVATSGDILIDQYNHLFELSRDPSTTDLSTMKSTIHIEDSIVSTFVQLVNMIGSDCTDHIIAFKTKQMSLRMALDMHDPVIKDILLLEDGSLVVTDNKNKCVKMAATSEGKDPRIVRIDLRTQPWGLTKLQVNVMAVTGHQCIYIITKTDDLHLQSTVKTRKDYWSVAALSPINLALTCKFPPSVDIVDITGRLLRTIEHDGAQESLFKVPQYLSTIYDKLLISDREGKTLTCVDQQGACLFTFRGGPKNELQHPKGVCASKSGQVYLVNEDDVWLLSSNGLMVSRVVMDLQGARAVTEENGTLCISVDGKGVVFYKIIDMSRV